MPNLRWLITELARRLWVRASIFAVAGIFTAIIGIALAPLIPADWSGKIGADSVGNVLQDGDTVKAGDLLIKLDGSILASELAIVEGQLYEIQARRARLAAHAGLAAPLAAARACAPCGGAGPTGLPRPAATADRATAH